jgi:nicotinamide-nucleotide amidase
MAEPAPAQRVVDALEAAGQSLAVAESLTGGLLTARVVDVPGASRVLRGAVVAYASDLKRELLGVDGALLERVGAVDAAVATQMAGGVRARLSADWGVATTGVAGPQAQDGAPPGRVFVAVCGPASTRWRVADVPGGRAAVRAGAVHEALELLLEVLVGGGAEQPTPCGS